MATEPFVIDKLWNPLQVLVLLSAAQAQISYTHTHTHMSNVCVHVRVCMCVCVCVCTFTKVLNGFIKAKRKVAALLFSDKRFFQSA